MNAESATYDVEKGLGPKDAKSSAPNTTSLTGDHQTCSPTRRLIEKHNQHLTANVKNIKMNGQLFAPLNPILQILLNVGYSLLWDVNHP
jgi:hypothetical protein